MCKFDFINSKWKKSLMWENPVNSNICVRENICISQSTSTYLNNHHILDSASCQFSLGQTHSPMHIASGSSGSSCSPEIYLSSYTLSTYAHVVFYFSYFLVFGPVLQIMVWVSSWGRKGIWWWDPISPIHIMNHVQHLCNTFATIWDDSCSRTTKDNKRQHFLHPFVMSYTILQYSTVLPFTSATFSNLFWCF